MEKFKDITAIILAGGNSSRMGVDKALLKINGVTFLESLVSKLKSIFEFVLMSTNNIHDYNQFGIPLIQDIYKNVGPIGAIHSGLTNSKTEKNIFISCDLPLITSELIIYMASYRLGKKSIIPMADGKLQTLCAVYSKSLLPELEKYLEDISSKEKYQLGIKHFLHENEIERINVEQLPFYNGNLFFNMNTMEDYLFLLKNKLVADDD